MEKISKVVKKIVVLEKIVQNFRDILVVDENVKVVRDFIAIKVRNYSDTFKIT